MVNSPDLDCLGDNQVVSTDSIDGRRLRFDDGWLAVRFSGTEPLLRIYSEQVLPSALPAYLMPQRAIWAFNQYSMQRGKDTKEGIWRRNEYCAPLGWT